ncbi:malvidin galactosylase UGT88C3-like [Typha latifolia]|uniref:malvidin galactosylase UGT88C3-like n=1 Tax=Typha latifolia TaxID=4733 RepID=UPI003C2BE5C4
MVEAGKRLFDINDSFSITVLVVQPPHPSTISNLQSYINEVSSTKYGAGICFKYLPLTDPPADFQDPVDFVSLFLQLHAPHVKAAIADSTTPVSALFIDFFATTIIDVANELGIPAYIFFTSNAAFLALNLHLPALEKKIPFDFEEMEGEVEIPGISAIPAMCLPTSIMNKKSRSYGWFVYQGKRFLEAKGVIVNTALELEPRLLEAINAGRCVEDQPTPPVYPIGPVIKFTDVGKHDCIEWLDAQPPSSVVFLCFGSMGCFDPPQVKEIAVGLERSGHRFLWVLRSPTVPGEIRHPVDADLEVMLPEGFVQRTKERGMVWPRLVPQTEILSHKAVDGFVTHCGWNSILESLWFGVPTIPWPLYAEQRLNAFEMVRVMGVAVELKVERNREVFVEAGELERAVRRLMEDSEERKKVKEKVDEMRAACRKAVNGEGSSYAYLQRLAQELSKATV